MARKGNGESGEEARNTCAPQNSTVLGQQRQGPPGPGGARAPLPPASRSFVAKLQASGAARHVPAQASTSATCKLPSELRAQDARHAELT